MAGRDARLKRLEQAADRDRLLRQTAPMKTLTVSADGRLRDEDGNDCGPVDGLRETGYADMPPVRIVVPENPNNKNVEG
jgi:hypothetical protein